HTITATFANTSIHATSQGTSATITVQRRTTSTSVGTCSPNPVKVNQGTTCTVTVTDTDAAGTKLFPSGTLSFTSSAASGSFSTCTLSNGTLPDSTCSVTYTPATIGAGTQTITATFANTSVHATSNGT